MSIEDKIIGIVKHVLEDEQVSLDTSIHNSQAWDSLNHLKILVEIEQEFSCHLPIEEIGNINSIKDWILLVENIAPVNELQIRSR